MRIKWQFSKGQYITNQFLVFSCSERTRSFLNHFQMVSLEKMFLAFMSIYIHFVALLFDGGEGKGHLFIRFYPTFFSSFYWKFDTSMGVK